MAELELEPRYWSVTVLRMLSCPVHREQSLLHIKKPYACQKTYRSEGEIPREGIWLSIKNREDRDCRNLLAPTESVEGSWRWAPRQTVTLKEEPTQKNLWIRPYDLQSPFHLNFTYPIREAALLTPYPRWRITYNQMGHESSSNLPRPGVDGEFCTYQDH